MQLVRHTLEYLEPGEWNMDAYPMFYACSADETKVGEQLITLLSHSLATRGEGLVIHPPGQNNATAELRDLSREAQEDHWSGWTEFRNSCVFYHQNLKTERSRLEKLREGKAGLDREKREKLAQLHLKEGQLRAEIEEKAGEGYLDKVLRDVHEEKIKLGKIDDLFSDPVSVRAVRAFTDKKRAVNKREKDRLLSQRNEYLRRLREEMETGL